MIQRRQLPHLRNAVSHYFLRVSCTLKPILLIFMVVLALQPDILKSKGQIPAAFLQSRRLLVSGAPFI